MSENEQKFLKPWAYFGLNILFSIPIIGFIFLIIFSFDNNTNRKYYARSFWCALLVAAIVFAIVFVIALLTGKF